MNAKLVGQRLVLVFLLGMVLLNDPVLSLFDKGAALNGIPLIYVYLMAVWAALIALIGLTISAGQAESEARRAGHEARK